MSLLKGSLSMKVESFSVREVMIKATEKEVAAIRVEVDAEWAHVMVGAQKWCKKLKTHGASPRPTSSLTSNFRRRRSG
jgi:hypothetical protein